MRKILPIGEMTRYEEGNKKGKIFHSGPNNDMNMDGCDWN